MRTDRNYSNDNRAGGRNNRPPVYPDHILAEPPRTGNGCLPAIIALAVLILIASIVASALFFIPWWFESQAEYYIPFNSQASAGIITNVKTGQSNVSQLVLKIPVSGGTISPDSPYLLRCKAWRLHADILSIPSWINTPHSYYQLTSIEGMQCRDQHGKVQARIDTKIIGSDDSFGVSIQNGQVWGFGISAKEITSNFVPVDGKSYKVIVTPNALLLIADR